MIRRARFANHTREVDVLRKVAWVIGSILSFSVVAWAQNGTATLEMTAEGEVQIAPDGHVSDYRLNSKLTASIADVIDRNVRGWRFEPIVIDGRSVTAKTAMHLSLKAEPADSKADAYMLRVSAVRFGEMKPKAHFKPPQYPASAVRAHVGGKVILAVHLDETGKVIDVQPYQTSLDARARNENEAEHYRRILEKASVEAAREWQYDLSERIDGKAVGMAAMIPVDYSLCNMPCSKPQSGTWRALIPGPVHPASWMHKEQVAENQDLSTLPEGQAAALDSRFHLKDNVIGKTL